MKQESQETAGDLVQPYGSAQKGTSLETDCLSTWSVSLWTNIFRKERDCRRDA